MRDGRVRRSRLGLSGQTVPLDVRLRRRLGLAQTTGVLVMDVVAEAAAARAELQVGDVIVTLDGMPVTGVDDLHRALTGERAGQPVAVAVLRRAELLTLTTWPDEA
jgi:S1-C subfamily serine protease